MIDQENGNAVKDSDLVSMSQDGYGVMGRMSIEAHSDVIDKMEWALDEADLYAKNHSGRMTHDEGHNQLLKSIHLQIMNRISGSLWA